MTNEEIAVQFNDAVKGFYKNATCRYENNTFIFSSTTKKTLASIMFDFAIVSKRIQREIKFVNGRIENKRYTVDAVFA